MSIFLSPAEPRCRQSLGKNAGHHATARSQRGIEQRREEKTHAFFLRSITELTAAVMSAPAADDEVGRMSAVSSEQGDAAIKADGRGKGSVKDRAATAAADSESDEGGSNSGGDESSDGDGESGNGEEVRGR